MHITYDWKYPKIFDPVLNFKGRYVCLSGGRGSGKSWFVAHYILDQCMQFKRDVLVIREYQSRSAESAHKLFKTIIDKHKLPYEITANKIVCTIKGNESEIVFLGLSNDTADSLRSYENFNIVFLEEAQKISIESFEVLNPTVRTANAIFFVAYNPDMPKKCLGKYIQGMYPDQTMHIHSTYLDNPFIDKSQVDIAEAVKKNKYSEYAHRWLGKYKTKSSEYLVVPDFTQDNIQPCNYVPSIPLHLTWDFNISPCSLIFAHKSEDKVFYFDELIEDLSTDKMIKKALDMYSDSKKIVINGDASGNSRRSCSEHSDYDLIKNELIRRGYVEESRKNRYAEKTFRLDLRRSNGDREKRFKSFNYKVLNPVTGIREIMVDPRCKKLIMNFEECSIKEGTSIFNEPTSAQIQKNPELKYLYHPLDAAQYLTNYYYPIEKLEEPRIDRYDRVAEWEKQFE